MRIETFIASALLVGSWMATGCVEADEAETGASRLANTLAGQGDILVASSYRDIYPNDNWAAAVEALQNSTFVVSYVAAASPYRPGSGATPPIRRHRDSSVRPNSWTPT